jgi:hypothetical protein
MKIKVKKHYSYVANDGTVFSNRKDCEYYENNPLFIDIGVSLIDYDSYGSNMDRTQYFKIMVLDTVKKIELANKICGGNTIYNGKLIHGFPRGYYFFNRKYDQWELITDEKQIELLKKFKKI